jgi:predicted transcriptional regulator
MENGFSSRHILSNTDIQKPAVGRRRSNIEIIADMLRVGENGAGKTEIMYSANMSYSQIQKYLQYLVNQGFITKANIDTSVVAYQVTPTGLKLLKAIDTLMTMLEPGHNQEK